MHILYLYEKTSTIWTIFDGLIRLISCISIISLIEKILTPFPMLDKLNFLIAIGCPVDGSIYFLIYFILLQILLLVPLLQFAFLVYSISIYPLFLFCLERKYQNLLHLILNEVVDTRTIPAHFFLVLFVKKKKKNLWSACR